MSVTGSNQSGRLAVRSRVIYAKAVNVIVIAWISFLTHTHYLDTRRRRHRLPIDHPHTLTHWHSLYSYRHPLRGILANTPSTTFNPLAALARCVTQHD